MGVGGWGGKLLAEDDKMQAGQTTGSDRARSGYNFQQSANMPMPVEMYLSQFVSA